MLATLLAALSVLAAPTDYTHLWWAEGYHTAEGAPPTLLYVQTSHYGAAFDVSRATIRHLGPIVAAVGYAEAATQPNSVVDELPTATLDLHLRSAETQYRCVSAAQDRQDHANYPVRLIEGGRWMHRFDVLGLEWQDETGATLPAESRLEVVAWPQRLVCTVYAASSADAPIQHVAIRLGAAHAEGAAGPQRVVWEAPGATPAEVDTITVRDGAQGEELPVRFDAAFYANVVSLPTRQWDMASNLDRIDRFPLRLENNADEARDVPLIFEMDGAFQGVTGLSPMLLDAQGRPTGIPVQISKNWHRLPEQRLLHEGPWFRGITQITVQAKSVWEGELAIAYARYGGLPAASHAQLCLVGWGGNQRWDQVAIGSFGESITYDPDVGLNRSIIDDVRPLMVTGMSGGQWEWTHNVGGGDFLVYLDNADKRQPLVRMKTAYESYGPVLTEVVYAGVSADGKIEARLEVMTPSSETLNRAIHRMRYDVREKTPFSRLAFYQLGADHYNDHQFTRIVRGNAEGMVEEWATERGGERYLRTGIVCEGEAPWFALLGGLPNHSWKQGAWADRALIIRCWRARLGGQEVPTPFAASYGTNNGIASANIELAPPPDLHELLPGDFVEAEVELMILPQPSEEYYGPSDGLRDALAEEGGAAVVLRHAAGAPRVDVQRGQVLQQWPLRIAASDGCAEFTVSGTGETPVTVTGIPDPTRVLVRVDDEPTPWYQLTPDDCGAYACTLLLRDRGSMQIQVLPRMDSDERG